MDRSPSVPRLLERNGPRRLSLVARKRGQRQAAGRRIARQVLRPLTPAQLALDPLARDRRSRAARLLRGASAMLASASVHAAVVVLGLLVGRSELGRREVIHQEVAVQMREHPPEPPPPPPAPPPPEKLAPPPPRVVKLPPPRTPPPATAPPPRVVGLSLESTAEGGEGPSFAVGNTRAGTTAPQAEAPSEVPPTPPPAPSAPTAANQVATRIPTAGISYTMPRRRAPSKPPYPETLKAQGIEADVSVVVSIDAAGRVSSVKVVKPSPYPEFNEAARRAASAEQFDPATRDGVPIPYPLSFTYRFRLEEQ
jgi:protein TonB